MNCAFASSVIGTACSNPGCGYRLRETYGNAPVRWCDADPEKATGRTARSTTTKPNIVRKAMGLCRSVAKWKLAGSPVRTKAEVNAALAICQRCDKLTDAETLNQRCGICGCPVNDRLDPPTKNKLAMATEHCPLSPSLW